MRQVNAGHVLTKHLLNRLNNKAWYFGVKGHFKIIKEKSKVTGANIFDKTNREIISIPLRSIKGDPNNFITDFEKTMASAQYQIELT